MRLCVDMRLLDVPHWNFLLCFTKRLQGIIFVSYNLMIPYLSSANRLHLVNSIIL